MAEEKIDNGYFAAKQRLEMQLNETTSKLQEMVNNWSDELLKGHRLLMEQQKDIQKAYAELKEKDEKLEESEKKYRAIVESAGDAIITLAPDSTILSWNDGACEIFGYPAEEALGRNTDELLVREDVKEEACQLTRKAHGGEMIRSFESVRYSKDGIPKNVLITATPLKDPAGKIYAISLIYKDISQLKMAQQQLIQTEKQAMLGMIAGSIGHELNNALTEMMIYAKLIREDPEDAEQVREMSDTLIEAVEKISIHGRNLLSLSRPAEPEMRMLSIERVLEETTQTMIICGILKRFKIVRRYKPNLSLVSADKNLMEQAIRNLEINSAHAMGDAGTLELGTKHSADGKCVEFYIKDTGHGMTEETQKKIFEPFFTTKLKGKGTGLGMHIVKGILDRHKGYIHIDSAVGKGTTMTVGIPALK